MPSGDFRILCELVTAGDEDLQLICVRDIGRRVLLGFGQRCDYNKEFHEL
jgi:hypothetical protein